MDFFKSLLKQFISVSFKAKITLLPSFVVLLQINGKREKP